MNRFTGMLLLLPACGGAPFSLVSSSPISDPPETSIALVDPKNDAAPVDPPTSEAGVPEAAGGGDSQTGSPVSEAGIFTEASADTGIPDAEMTDASDASTVTDSGALNTDPGDAGLCVSQGEGYCNYYDITLDASDYGQHSQGWLCSAGQIIPPNAIGRMTCIQQNDYQWCCDIGSATIVP